MDTLALTAHNRIPIEILSDLDKPVVYNKPIAFDLKAFQAQWTENASQGCKRDKFGRDCLHHFSKASTWTFENSPYFWLYNSMCCGYTTDVGFLFDGSFMLYNADVDEPLTFDTNFVIVVRPNVARISWSLLSKFESLTALFLPNCNLDNDDMQQLALLPLPHLTNLSLPGNKISCDGVCVLVDMLMHNTVLKVLELQRNMIHYKGIKAIAKLIETNTTVTHLSICNNPFIYMFFSVYGHAETILEEALKRNHTLVEFCAAPIVVRIDPEKLGHRDVLGNIS